MKKYLILVILLAFLLMPVFTAKAQFGNIPTWKVIANTLYTVAGNAIVSVNNYLNFGGTSGSSGYGLRSNSGNLEYKNSGGSWTALSGGGGGGATRLTELSDVSSVVYTDGYILRGNGTGYVSAQLAGSDINNNLAWISDLSGFDLDDLADGTTYKRLTVTKDGYINQDITIGSSPGFLGLTLNSIGYSFPAARCGNGELWASDGSSGFVCKATSTLGLIKAGDNISLLTNNAGYLTSLSLNQLSDSDLSSTSTGDILYIKADGTFGNTATSSLSISINDITGTIDISSRTNLGVTATGLELSGDNIALSANYNIPKTASTTDWQKVYEAPININYAFSSSTPILSGHTHYFSALPYALTCFEHLGKVENGTSLVIGISDGTNHATTLTATTTANVLSISTNNTFIANEPIQIRFGTNTGDVLSGFYSARCYRTLE
jgi:hypothetical protein